MEWDGGCLIDSGVHVKTCTGRFEKAFTCTQALAPHPSNLPLRNFKGTALNGISTVHGTHACAHTHTHTGKMPAVKTRPHTTQHTTTPHKTQNRTRGSEAPGVHMCTHPPLLQHLRGRALLLLLRHLDTQRAAHRTPRSYVPVSSVCCFASRCRDSLTNKRTWPHIKHLSPGALCAKLP